MADAPRRFDAVVVGGGPAGAAAALTLARGGYEVLLADALSSRVRASGLKIGEALPPAVAPLLRDLGLWERFLADGHLRSPGTVAAWGASRPGTQDFIFDPNGEGWHLDRLRFDRLLRRAAGEAGAALHEGCQARLLAGLGADSWRLALTGRGAAVKTIECKVLLNAAGRNCRLARRLGARRLQEHDTVAVYAAFAADPEDRDARALVEAAPDGWWYTALLPGQRRIVSYLTGAKMLQGRMRTATGFDAALRTTEHVGARLPAGCQSMLQGPYVTLAGGARLRPAAGAGWLALGDAALAFDPVSSQGVLTALFTGMIAAQAAAAQLAGDNAPTREYQRRLDRIWSAYERNHRACYGLERRWRQRPFWAQRQPPSAGLD